jgi:hypothetical protein
MRVRPINKIIRIISGHVFGKIGGIALSPFGIYMDGPIEAGILNHEKIHWRQQNEMLILPFYLWYLTEFLIRRMYKSRKDAYLSISFEQEAYLNQHDASYLKTRRPYRWIKYLR